MKLTWLTFLATLLLAGPASADVGKRSFSVTFDQVSNNCTDAGTTLTQATISLDEDKRGSVTVAVPGIPKMVGTARKGGKFKARTKKSATSKPNIAGRYSVGGRVNGKQIRFLLIAEYFIGGKPLCTQSWNAKSK